MRRLSLVCLLSVFTLQWGCGNNSSNPSGPSTPNYTYPYLLSIGTYGSSGTGNGKFSGPCNILIYHNALFVVDQLNILIQKFDLNGNFLGQVATGGSNPYGLTVDGNGIIYLSDWGNNTITKWDQNLNLIGTYTPSIATTSPDGLAVDSSNNVYIADAGGHQVMRCGNSGSGCATVTGSFASPIGVGVDGSGNIYVADNGNQIVQKFNSSLGGGTTIINSGTTTGLVHVPQVIAFDTDGNLLVSDYPSAGRIQKFTPSGSYIMSISAPGSDTFGYNDGIVVDPQSKDVYVSDYNRDAIYKYAPY